MAAEQKLPAFVMPHYSDSDRGWDFLRQALESFVAQSDPAWTAIVVDDASPNFDCQSTRIGLLDMDPRIAILREPSRRGAGRCRNIGVKQAAAQGASFVLFMDADDICHPHRVDVSRRHVYGAAEPTFVYSTFDVIDEYGDRRPLSDLTPSIREILETHRQQPVNGRNAFRRVCLETGYTTPSNTVAVTTSAALATPFPEVDVSEDYHTWMRMLATGINVVFAGDIPSLRRIPSWAKGSSSRARFGDDFYWMKFAVDYDGLNRALEIAVRSGTVDASETDVIRRAFHTRQAQTMEREMNYSAAVIAFALAAVE